MPSDFVSAQLRASQEGMLKLRTKLDEEKRGNKILEQEIQDLRASSSKRELELKTAVENAEQALQTQRDKNQAMVARHKEEFEHVLSENHAAGRLYGGKEEQAEKAYEEISLKLEETNKQNEGAKQEIKELKEMAEQLTKKLEQLEREKRSPVPVPVKEEAEVKTSDDITPPPPPAPKKTWVFDEEDDGTLLGFFFRCH